MLYHGPGQPAAGYPTLGRARLLPSRGTSVCRLRWKPWANAQRLILSWSTGLSGQIHPRNAPSRSCRASVVYGAPHCRLPRASSVVSVPLCFKNKQLCADKDIQTQRHRGHRDAKTCMQEKRTVSRFPRSQPLCRETRSANSLSNDRKIGTER